MMSGPQNSRLNAIAKSRENEILREMRKMISRCPRESLALAMNQKKVIRGRIVIRRARILLYGIYGIHSHLPPIQSPHQASAHQRFFGMAIRGRSCAGVSNAYSNS